MKVKRLLVVIEPASAEITSFDDKKDGGIDPIDARAVPIDSR